MGKERVYPIGYKPKICLVRCTLRYCDKKYLKFLKDKKVKHKYQNKVYEINIPQIVLVLDENNNIPTQRQKEQAIRKAWKRHGLTTKIDKYKLFIKNIKIISTHGRISYSFDEFID